MNETTNKYDNPILICIGSHKDFHNDGKLFCGGCGHQYSPDEAEAMLKDIKIKVVNACGSEVHTRPLHCIKCCRQYKSVYFNWFSEISKIVQDNLFKKRYVTKHGELILVDKYELPLFIPNRVFDKQRRMSYDEAIAYMLYSSLYPLGYTSSDMTLYVGSDYCEMYCVGAPVNPYLYEDITNISKESFRCHLGEFDKILEIMRDMESSIFFSIGGNEND